MVDIEAQGRRISVSFTHDLLDEPKVVVEEPNYDRKVIFSVCEQNRANDWARFIQEVSQMDKNSFTLCVARWTGNPVNHQVCDSMAEIATPNISIDITGNGDILFIRRI